NWTLINADNQKALLSDTDNKRQFQEIHVSPKRGVYYFVCLFEVSF
ncbi:MAG: hypothetical protein HW382_762, partial [Deltaproteobacteria bacterium]|nr:hypothetical protein [Deltaproteobacteria bacterium]